MSIPIRQALLQLETFSYYMSIEAYVPLPDYPAKLISAHTPQAY